MWEHTCISEIFVCIPTYIWQGPYVWNFISLLAYFCNWKTLSLTYLKNMASRAFKPSTKLILIRSKLHWLVHPIFYLCWASFFWFSLSILCLLSYFHLVNLSSRDQSLLHNIINWVLVMKHPFNSFSFSYNSRGCNVSPSFIYWLLHWYSGILWGLDHAPTFHMESMWNPCHSRWIPSIPYGICFGWDPSHFDHSIPPSIHIEWYGFQQFWH